MSRHLPVAHLSAEAVAAVADGVLSGAPLARAERHLGTCLDCAQEVVAQRQASFALRAADLPQLPVDLTERLLGLPLTVGFDDAVAPAAVSADGEPLFATATVSPALPATSPGRIRTVFGSRRFLGR